MTKRVTLTATFPCTADGRNDATYEWSDGLVCTTPGGGRPGRLPHDLEHYILEAQVKLPYGFWTLAGKQAPFQSFTHIGGQWPRSRKTWFEQVKKKHAGEMVKADSLAGLVNSLARGVLDLERDWREITRQLTRAYRYGSEDAAERITMQDLRRVLAFDQDVRAAWAGVPVGGFLEVTWPRVEACLSSSRLASSR